MAGQRKGMTGLSADTIRDSDFALLEQVAGKDKQAFEKLYKSYHRRLFQFAYRMVHQPDVAEEVVNDAMLVAWQKANTFNQRSRVSTWLMGIAYRKGLENLRKLNRYNETSIEDEPELERALESTAQGPAQSFASGELTEQLCEGINSLSTEHRSVVELTALGYSYGEIAEIVNCPLNTVKTRMFYARRRLKEFLSDMQPPATAL
ncbi:MAG: RNA polymerase sigma factor [Gammaproteobacteria bacterium]